MLLIRYTIRIKVKNGVKQSLSGCVMHSIPPNVVETV